MFLTSDKCPYCKSKDLHIKRTSPALVYGCKACEKRVEIMARNGMSKADILRVLKG